MRIIGHIHFLGDLWFGHRMLGGALGVDHGIFVFDLLPLEALLAAVRVKALTILARDIEQATGHFGGDIGILDPESRGLDGEWAPITADELLANSPRAVADDVLGMFAK